MNLIYENYYNMCFKFLTKNKIIYHQCQEDPRVDKAALNLTPRDNIFVITSAGCNILDYLLEDVNHIYAIDINWMQNSLAELKLVMLKELDYETFFEFFGNGLILNPKQIYYQKIQKKLSFQSRQYWDENISLFDKKISNGFYRSTLLGKFSHIFKNHAFFGIQKMIEKLLSADSIEEQAEIYTKKLSHRLSSTLLKLWDSPFTLPLLGVPYSQRRLVQKHYPGGIVAFSKFCLNYVMTKTHLKNDNYFYYQYLAGNYSHESCPNYLKESHFNKLKSMDLLNKVTFITSSVSDYLKSTPINFSKFILLDHMDWMSGPSHFSLLEEQWNKLLNNAEKGAIIIFRSAGTNIKWMENVFVHKRNKPLFQCLNFNTELANTLLKEERHYTYGSFHVAELT